MVGIPKVGKMSRGICLSAMTEPSATAITAAMTVRGLRRAGWTRFIAGYSLRGWIARISRLHSRTKTKICSRHFKLKYVLQKLTVAGMVQPSTKWLLLLYGLPTRRSTERVSLWRQLRRLGAVPLKTSAYLLPDT